MHYFATMLKWDSLREGKLANRLPDFVPGRDLMSSSRAQALKVICRKSTF